MAPVLRSCIRSAHWLAAPPVGRGLDWALVAGFAAYSGAGGTINAMFTYWLRDKGFGMGQYVPRLVSPVTGKAQVAPVASARRSPAACTRRGPGSRSTTGLPPATPTNWRPA